MDEETRFPIGLKEESNPVPDQLPAGGLDENSRGSTGSASASTGAGASTGKKKSSKFEVFDPDVLDRVVTADQVLEYQWPANERHADFFMLQEQIADFLGVKAFKRKYPKMVRRNLERDERIFLKDRGVVSETMFDLGVTVLRSEEVLDAMAHDFPEKFEELRRAMMEKRQKRIQERRAANAPSKPAVDKGINIKQITDPRLRCIHEAADFNARFNRERREERPCALDLQSFNVVHPTHKILKLKPELAKLGNYPVALLPMQYTDYYRKYSPGELRYLPVNTVLCGPINPYADLDLGEKKESPPLSPSSSSSSSSSDEEPEPERENEEQMEVDDKEKDKEKENEMEVEKKPEVKCKCCQGTELANPSGVPEKLILCTGCKHSAHPGCWDLNPVMVSIIKTYDWTCTDCKRCSKCDKQDDEGVSDTGGSEMIFCDYCDRGFHLACVGLGKIPEGPWHCRGCEKCVSCGVDSPGIAGEGEMNTGWVYMKLEGDSTGCSVMLCRTCGPLFREKKYCPKCFKCYSRPSADMAKCSTCSKWVHFACHDDEVAGLGHLGSILTEEKKRFFRLFHENGSGNGQCPDFCCSSCSGKKTN